MDAIAQSLTQLRSIDLRTDDGRRLSFRVEGDVSSAPSHAREHMVLAEPVTYRETPDGVLAVPVED